MLKTRWMGRMGIVILMLTVTLAGFVFRTEASEQQVVYTDMIEAYEQKRYVDARDLARRHLDKYSAFAEAAKNDLDLESAVRRALGVIHSALSAESMLEDENPASRDAEFLDFLKKELDRAKEAAGRLRNISESVRAYISSEMGICASLWIRAAGNQRGVVEDEDGPWITRAGRTNAADEDI